MDKKVLLIVFVISIFICLNTYFLLRDMIWSIIWCEIGGKYKKLRKLKKNVKFFDRVKMKYLYAYVKNYQRGYRFWMIVRYLYIFIEFVFAFVCVIFFFIADYVFIKHLIWGFFYQAFVFSLVILFQFDHNRNTKYDRIRENKRNRK